MKTNKSPEMQDFLDAASMSLFGRVRNENFCVTCNAPIRQEDFRDALSRKEFGISGMCQACQDKVFGK